MRHSNQTADTVRGKRLLILTTWADDGRWPFLSRLRGLGVEVDLMEPLFQRCRFVPHRIKRFLANRSFPWQTLMALVRGRRYDAVATWNTRSGVFLGLVARLVPARLRPHIIVRDFHLDMTRFASPFYFLHVLMARLAAPCVDSFLTTSDSEADLYSCMLGIPPEAIRFFPDTPGSAFLESERTFAASDYVFAFGNSDRDFDSLVKAAPDIARPVVILSQTYRPRLPLPDNVTCIGRRLPQTELLELIGRAAVVVIPLKSHFVAAGQNAMLEVMCLSKPMVVTSNLTTMEHATNGRDALFHPPRDAQALAASVRALLDDPALALAMGREARRRALALPGRQVEIFLEELVRVLSVSKLGNERIARDQEKSCG